MLKTKEMQWQIKFDLMYYLHMRYNEIMALDLAELTWYYQRLKEVKDHEIEFEKMKLELTLAASGVGKATKLFR